MDSTPVITRNKFIAHELAVVLLPLFRIGKIASMAEVRDLLNRALLCHFGNSEGLPSISQLYEALEKLNTKPGCRFGPQIFPASAGASPSPVYYGFVSVSTVKMPTQEAVPPASIPGNAAADIAQTAPPQLAPSQFTTSQPAEAQLAPALPVPALLAPAEHTAAAQLAPARRAPTATLRPLTFHVHTGTPNKLSHEQIRRLYSAELKGLSGRKAARILGVAESTVRAHRTRHRTTVEYLSTEVAEFEAKLTNLRQELEEAKTKENFPAL